MITRDEAYAEAGQILAQAVADTEAMSPRQVAELAYSPTGTSVNQLEDQIRVERGLEPIHARAS